MYWNHRVCKQEVPSLDGETETQYGIHEVYYNDGGKPSGCTENPIAVVGEDIDEIRETVKRFHKALSLPVLDLDTIVWAEDE
jgi:hypothetical protein